MRATSTTSNPKRKKLLIVSAILLVVVAAIGLFLILAKNNYPPKEQIQELALTAAKEYCRKDQKLERAYCDSLRITETGGPVDYGPTDGRDEYTGNWFVTAKSSNKPDSLIYVVTNFSGDVQYINITGHAEYPYCKDGYAVYPEEPEKNGEVRCGYYKE